MPTSSKRQGAEWVTSPEAPIKKKGGRPKLYQEPRRKTSLWLPVSLLNELEAAKLDRQAEARKAGKRRWKEITVRGIIEASIREHLQRRKRST